MVGRQWGERPNCGFFLPQRSRRTQGREMEGGIAGVRTLGDRRRSRVLKIEGETRNAEEVRLELGFACGVLLP